MTVLVQLEIVYAYKYSHNWNSSCWFVLAMKNAMCLHENDETPKVVLVLGALGITYTSNKCDRLSVSHGYYTVLASYFTELKLRCLNGN